MTDALVVLCTCPNPEEASRLARGLVENRYAACVNIFPQIRSIYRWKGETQDEEEVLMIIKTSTGAFAALQAWLLDRHSYDVPEILALPVAQGTPDYLDWLLNGASAG
jgi:periplasmic divalent cation tolerance protein